MGEILEYPEVLQEIRGAMNPGRLKLQSSSVMFKNMKTGRMDQFQANDVERATWLIRARGYCLKLCLKNGNIHRYDGFKEAEFDRLSSFINKNYHTKLEKVDLSTKGWNWGSAEFEGNGLNFNVDNQHAFEIPLNNVSHSTTSKNEVTLEFHQNDDAAVSLMELRFHIPPDNNNPDNDPVMEFHKNVLSKADIIQATGTGIVTFEDIQCLTPRGRYDLKIYPTFMQLHGKTFDYKIPFTTILRLFLLPHRDGRQMFFVISLDPPIKQGQTRYHFLVMGFTKETEITVEIGLSEEEISEKFEGKLQKEMSGPEYEIVSRIMKTVVSRKITIPGSFIGNSGTQSVACSYKAATGFLYPLERGFIFVHKPPVHIRFDEVSNVNFARSAGSSRSFDFEIETKTGTNYTFNSIEKDEYGKLYDFVTQKKLRVKNIGNKVEGGKPKYDEMDTSSDEGGHDAYLERMKREGKERQEAEDEDSDDEEDEDFDPGESGSEVPEEYDTDAVSSSSSEEESDSGSGSGSGDEEAKAEKAERKKKRQEEKERRKKEKKAITIKEPGTQKQRRKRKEKKERDPDMPKRPTTAYMLWFNANREALKKEHPGLSVTELSKKAGEAWKTLDDKSEWEGKAKEAKEKYKEAMDEYRKKQKEAGVSTKSPKKKSKSAPAKSPAKSPQKAGNFKSKEFISESESDSDDSDRPLKKKSKKEESDGEASLPSDEPDAKTPESSEAESGGGSDSD